MDVWEGMMIREFLYHLVVQKQILVSCDLSLISLSLNLPAKTFLHSLYQQPCFFTFSATDFSSPSQQQLFLHFLSNSSKNFASPQVRMIDHLQTSSAQKVVLSSKI
jgi:hypothetical protein